MNILFLTFGKLSVASGGVRPVSMLRALADAGHRVDVVASRIDIPEHPCIHVLEGGREGSSSRRQVRVAAMKAASKVMYDAVHAVDDAVELALRICRIRKSKLVYEANRCLTGPDGIPPSWSWKLFPGHFHRREKRILDRAAAVFSPCPSLSADLRAIDGDVHVVELGDIPMQSLISAPDFGRELLLSSFDGKHPSAVVVCAAFTSDPAELKKVLLAVRKVVDANPGAVFFIKCVALAEARDMAANLDILGQCVFLELADATTYLAALDIADAALLVPDPGSRYTHQEVYTLLRAASPLIMVHHDACDHLLTEQNSVQVLSSSESMAEGMLRAIQEPLFSLAIATEGQQLVADGHSFSSFKHRVRMAYHEIFKNS